MKRRMALMAVMAPRQPRRHRGHVGAEGLKIGAGCVVAVFCGAGDGGRDGVRLLYREVALVRLRATAWVSNIVEPGAHRIGWLRRLAFVQLDSTTAPRNRWRGGAVRREPDPFDGANRRSSTCSRPIQRRMKSLSRRSLGRRSVRAGTRTQPPRTPSAAASPRRGTVGLDTEDNPEPHGRLPPQHRRGRAGTRTGTGTGCNLHVDCACRNDAAALPLDWAILGLVNLPTPH